MKNVAAIALPLLLLPGLLLTACGKTPGGGNGGGGDTYATPDVTMGQTDFDKHNLTITAGTTVKFTDPSSAATHILCIGENGNCTKGAQGPSELTAANGFEVDPGNSKDVVFSNPGTYKIACTVHPQMNMTITVQ